MTGRPTVGDASSPELGGPLEVTAVLSRSQAIAIGERLDRYVVTGFLGRGGMGEVYLAYDPQLDRKVALKIVRELRGAVVSESAKGRILREAQAMARISHPNVVAVHDAGIHAGQVYLAMDYVPGEDLQRWLEVRHPWRQTLAAFREAGAGLAAAHRAGVVHRDFKPSNVLRAEDGHCRVVDFGLARPTLSPGVESSPGAPVVEVAPALTQAGVISGTLGYMAPEQVLGEPTDARTDQFSFCVALYEALYGQKVYKARDLEAFTVEVNLIEAPAPPSGTGVPSWLFPILARGLSRAPAERWPDMDALLAALARDPGSGKRRRKAALVAAGLLAAAGLAVALGVRQERRSCETSAEEADRAWNEAVARTVRAAVLGAHVSYGPSTLARVEVELTQYVRRWRTARLEACPGWSPGRARSNTPAEACLAEGLTSLKALLESLGSGAPAVIQHAAVAMSRLPDPAACASAAPFARLSAEEAREEAEIRALLVRARTFENTNQFPSSLLEANEADRRARAARRLDLAANAAVVRGSTQMQGQATVDEAALQEGAVAALSSGNDRALAQLWILVSGRKVAEESATELAQSYLTLAGGALERLPTDFEVAAKFHAVRAELAVSQGKPEEALQEDQAAEALLRRAFGDGSSEVAIGMTNVGADLANMGRVREAASYFQLAHAIHERLEGRENSSTAISGSDLAASLCALGRYAEGKVPLEDALRVLESTVGPESHSVAVALGNLGIVAESEGRIDEGVELLRRARAIYFARNPKAPDAFESDLQLCDTLRRAKRSAEARTVCEQAKVGLAAVSPTHPTLAFVFESLALLEMDAHHTKPAVRFLDEAERRAKESGNLTGAWQFLAARARLVGLTSRNPEEIRTAFQRARQKAAEAEVGPTLEMRELDAWEAAALTQHRGR